MTQRLRVLAVDDQPIIREALAIMLSDAPDIELRTLDDPEAAIATALEWQPHALLLDLNMEPIDGLELLRRVRARSELADLSVVMLSTAEEPETKVEAFRLGANDYVVKLPSALELIARVRYHARAYLAQREREVAFRALMESRAVLAARNTEIERQKLKLESMNLELVESSITDALTGLRNRRYLKLFLEELPTVEMREPGFERRADPDSTLTFYLLDLDHFKQINDLHGHDAGDAVLVEIGHRLRHNLRGLDAALRWGGEELLVIGRGGGEAAASALAARLLELIGGTPMALPSGKPLRVTCSIGFVSLPWTAAFGTESALNVDQALSLSDSGLYLAKADGRNQAVGILPNGDMAIVSRLAKLAANSDALRAEDGVGVRLVRLRGPVP